MIDLHTHTIFSDGELIPSEMARRAQDRGYRALAITDHGDHSNVDFIVPRVAKACRKLSDALGMPVIPGIELTHVPPEYIAELVREARERGARLVVVHGETIAEPVLPGTNRAAIEAAVDILAHPGLITEADVLRAKEQGVCLEISARKGHSLTNGHVVALARRFEVPLVLNTDSHGPQDLITRDQAVRVALGAGMNLREVEEMMKNSEELVRRATAGGS
ncbi:MAG: PHP domain-containing protein [Deltaproteobacteria bacterium HGW-Deltaproteobacteria-19]|nr:MAG: PHP domain-containing protein [Deltaproteobacteria bacterium HGW-Deltaproteobacteria-19]